MNNDLFVSVAAHRKELERVRDEAYKEGWKAHHEHSSKFWRDYAESIVTKAFDRLTSRSDN